MKKVVRAKDLSGQTFGRLKVKEYAGTTDGRSARWRCLCECGAELIVLAYNLKSGNTTGCGCIRGVGNTTHGYTGTATYNCYKRIYQRCFNPKNEKYPSYGGRGITVCPEWLASFEVFLADMGERPNGCSIERKDNDGPYSKDNCRWATAAEQSINKRNNVKFCIDGETLCLSEWAQRCGIEYHTIVSRLGRGWGIKRALFEEVDETRRNSRSKKGCVNAS